MQENTQNDLLHILGMLQSCGKIIYYSKDFNSHEDFYNHDHQVYFNAALALLINIGELVNKTSSELKTKYSNTDWVNIKGFRNKAAHNYEDVDLVITFRIIKDEIPKLQKDLHKIVESEVQSGVFSKEEYEIAQNSKSEFFEFIDFSKIKVQ